MILLHPLFLIGLLAVSIPIIVHLFNFRRYKKVYFSNVEYLEQLQTETKKQSRLREYIILATRILLIIFLVLAFAQPTIPNKNNQLKQGGCAVSIYLDNSFSMENTSSDGSLLEVAKEKAREILAAYKPSDLFQLITNDMEGSQFRWLSKEEFLSTLEEVEVSSASPTLATISSKQQDFLRSNTSDNRLAYVISDFQRTTTDIEHLRQDSLIVTTLVPLEAQAINNLSIDSVYFQTPAFVLGSNVSAIISVSNHGSEDIKNLPLKLFINDNERALSSIDIQSHSSQTISIPFTIEQEGMLQCYVETTDYPITFDDRYYFSLNIWKQISMLEVSNTQQPFLRRLFEGDSLIQYHAVTERAIDFNTLSEHQFLVLNGLSSIPSGLAQTLTSFMEAGGVILTIPTADAHIETYNQWLASLQAPTLTQFHKGAAKITDLNAQASLYQSVFSGKVTEEIELPTVKGYFKTTSTSHTVVESIMAIGNDPYLTTTQHGSGRLYLLTAPLAPEYCDFAQQALFVPTLYNMALFSLPVTSVATTMGYTSPTLLPCTSSHQGEVWHLSNASGFDLIPDIQTHAGRAFLHPHNQIRESGCYTLTCDGGKENLYGISFNYNRAESKMDFLPRTEISNLIKDYHLSGYQIVKNASRPLDQYIRSQQESTSLWRHCLIVALILLVLETILIRYHKFGA